MATFHPYSDNAYTSNHFSSTSGGSVSPDTDEGVGRAKVAKWSKEGPVKNACLSCRNKKAKCDAGLPKCGQCEKKQLECVYVKSRRGGARKKREVAPSALQEFLKRLDGLLGLPDYSNTISPGASETSDDMTNVVRQFACRNEILRCYYDEVHPFLAMLPTRQNFDAVLSTLLPESPLLLAVRTILVLVPHSQDPNPKSPTSKRLRTAMSAVLGKQTMDLIEATLENPSLETVQALCILSLWEWANSGNLARSRARSGQAIQVAMELGVHEMDKYSPGERAMEGEDWRMDMARRTWWTVYVAQLVSAFVSGTSPVIGPDDSRIHVLFPVCSLDDNSWPNWVKTNRQCVRVFGIVNAVYYSELAGLANAWGPRPHAMSAEAKAEMRQQVVDVDRQIQESMKQAEATSIIEFVPGGEEEVVRNQQTSTRLGLATLHIHIHRQQAFPEVSLFSKKICGLPQSKDFSASMPMLDSVAVPQALADGKVPVYRESSAEKGYDREVDMKGPGNGQGNGDEYDDEADLGNLDFIGDMWQPDTYPENLPAPWFTHADGAASLWTLNELSPMHYPTISAWIAPTDSPSSRRPSVISSSSVKPHKAWGVDTNDKPTSPSPSSDDLVIFPPGISLARCATAAHTIVRLEVLHRSASIAMTNGPPKWLPFCACGLVNGAYAFLLLALAVQAENTFGDRSDERADEVEMLLTNVKVILAGLEAYGVMWAGIEVMAGEVRAALEAATRLPYEVRAQIESGSPNESGNSHPL